MKKQVIYQEDTNTQPGNNANIPVLGENTVPPGHQTQVNKNEQKNKQSVEQKESVLGNNKQMQNDMRYTTLMKKDENIKKDDAEKKIAAIADRSDNLLMKLTAVFPFDLFPDVITIDANKVTIIDKNFFASESITSILLEEITDVVVESNFFLAQLVITHSHHPLKPEKYIIPNLRKQEALRAQEIIQGLLVLRLSEGIDLSKLRPDEITDELATIGQRHENVAAL